MCIFSFVLEFLVLHMEMYKDAIARIPLNVVKIWRHTVRIILYIVRKIAELTWLFYTGIGTTHDLNNIFIFRYKISQLNQKSERKIWNQYTITWTWSI